MRLFGFEIRRAEPKWVRQKDLFFRCPKCGDFVKLRRLADGRSILSALYEVNKVNRIELSHTCGGMIFICSSEAIEEARGIDLQAMADRIVKEAKKGGAA
ncbi:MAG: hypothetical protein JNG85_14640 [Spirochaetaceae bacterium]|nr:hypothetical protein [Spirochaetaceae bacterium]